MTGIRSLLRDELGTGQWVVSIEYHLSFLGFSPLSLFPFNLYVVVVVLIIIIIVFYFVSIIKMFLSQPMRFAFL